MFRYTCKKSRLRISNTKVNPFFLDVFTDFNEILISGDDLVKEKDEP